MRWEELQQPDAKLSLTCAAGKAAWLVAKAAGPCKCRDAATPPRRHGPAER